MENHLNYMLLSIPPANPTTPAPSEPTVLRIPPLEAERARKMDHITSVRRLTLQGAAEDTMHKATTLKPHTGGAQ